VMGVTGKCAADNRVGDVLFGVETCCRPLVC
jgi:hypothetical protein